MPFKCSLFQWYCISLTQLAEYLCRSVPAMLKLPTSKMTGAKGKFQETGFYDIRRGLVEISLKSKTEDSGEFQ